MQHLAIIPDGNRRWAKQHLKESVWGHRKGTETVQTAIEFCIKKGIKHLSFYTFSLENFNRPEAEKNYLFNLLAENFGNELPKLIKEGVRVRFIGQSSLFPEKLKPVIQKIETATKHLSKLNLNLLFCYSGRQEIIEAVKNVAKKVKDGFMSLDDINEDSFYQNFWSSEIPEPDLIIRTSGRARLSNFLLYQAAYSEFDFLDCHWPEVTEKHLQKCFDKFKSTQRNFGR
ncbi:MAG: polyprenyl diphosphate synthase [bacterium]